MTTITRPWTRQPPAGTPINLSKHLCRGLVYAGTGDITPGDIGGIWTKINGPIAVPSASGMALSFATNQYIETTTPPVTALPLTVFAVVTFASVTGFQAVWGSYINATTVIEFGTWDNKLGVYIRDAGGIFVFQATGTLAIGVPTVIALTIAGATDRRVFINGKVVVSDDRSKGHTGAIKQTWGAYREAAVGDYMTGTIALRMMWHRALSNAEIWDLSQNPWQVFEKIYRVASSAAAAIVVPASMASGMSCMGGGLSKAGKSAGLGYMG